MGGTEQLCWFLCQHIFIYSITDVEITRLMIRNIGDKKVKCKLEMIQYFAAISCFFSVTKIRSPYFPICSFLSEIIFLFSFEKKSKYKFENNNQIQCSYVENGKMDFTKSFSYISLISDNKCLYFGTIHYGVYVFFRKQPTKLQSNIFNKPQLCKQSRNLFVIDTEVRTRTGPSDHTSKASAKNLEESKKKLRKRRRKNVIRTEEVYCDKDRAAAVNLGSKDIKQSLKLKRKQDRTRIMQIPEEAEPGTFLALGNYEMCRGDLSIAINFMGKVICLFLFFKLMQVT